MKKRCITTLLLVPLLFSCGNNPGTDPVPPTPSDYWPVEGINAFLSSKGIRGVTIPTLEIKNQEELLSASVEQQDDFTYFSIVLSEDVEDEYTTKLTASSYTFQDPYYFDINNKVAIKVWYDLSTYISIYDKKDIEVVPPEPEDLKTITYTLYDIFGKKQAATLGPITSTDGFMFTANVNGGQTNPNSTNDGGKQLRLYTENTLTISGNTIRKIEYNFNTDKIPSISCDVGNLVKNSDVKYTWSGRENEVAIKALSQSRITTVTISYIESKPEPVPVGLKTVAEVYELAATIQHPDVEWYLTEQEVIVRIEAVDAIDSIATGGGLDGDARGKVLVVDETGYIVCSSGVSKNNPISFYQRVKDYIKAGTTQYEVTGLIAFFNGVVEIKVETYTYKPDLIIEKNYDNYIKNKFTKSSEFVNDVVNNTKPNSKGYGVHNVIQMTGLTYFNKYNDAGSYYFLDQDGMIVPVYSLLDKDRSSLIEGHCYDIIGLESLYNNRPSFRIMKIKKSSLEPQKFNFDDNVVEVTDLSQFYNIGQSTDMKYVKSELTVYKADVYVSRYAEDKYSFNTAYYYDLATKEYSTGSTQENAVSRKSLGIFNEDLTYKQTLLDFLLEDATNEEEANSKKVTLYFTLARLDIVNHSNFWRVNIFEDLVFSYEYYKAPKLEMTFDVNKSECTYDDGVYQQWTHENLSLKNESTDTSTIERSVDFLKIVDGTSLTISFTNNIIGFKLYTGTFSHIMYMEGADIRAYHMFADYTEILLNTPTNKIEISDFAVGGSATYLKVTSIMIAYEA